MGCRDMVDARSGHARPDSGAALGVAGVSCALCFGLLVTGNWAQSMLGFEFRDATHRVVLFAFLVAMLLVSAAVRRNRAAPRAALAVMRANEAAQVAWSCAMEVYLMAGGPDALGPQPLWLSALSGWMMAGTLNEWNPHMAARRAGDSATVVLATLGSTGLFLVTTGAAAAGWAGAGPVLVCLPAASACCGLALRRESEKLTASEPPSVPDGRTRGRMLRYFIRERLVFGVAFGLTMSAAVAHPAVPSQPVVPAASLAVGAAMVAAACLALALDARRYLRPYLVLCLPLMLALACLLIFGHADIGATAQLAVAVTWLTWYIYSFSEMPVYREAGGEAPLPFGWTEKCVTLLTIMPVSLAVAAVRNALPQQAQETFAAVGVASMYAILCLFLAMIAVLLYRHFPDSGGIAKTGLTDDEAAEAMAAGAGLTPREADVLRLMCLGYTRPRIMSELGISEGTAKTHIHHVYEKTGIPGHDELVDAFRAVKAGRS